MSKWSSQVPKAPECQPALLSDVLASCALLCSADSTHQAQVWSGVEAGQAEHTSIPWPAHHTTRRSTAARCAEGWADPREARPQLYSKRQNPQLRGLHGHPQNSRPQKVT